MTPLIRAVRRDQAGVTLVEVMVAVSILVLGLVAVITGVSSGYLGVMLSGGQSKATAYAAEVLEQLKNQPFAALSSGNDAPEPGFTRTWTVTTTGTTPNRLATITVAVRWGQSQAAGWFQGTNTDQTFRLVTMRAE